MTGDVAPQDRSFPREARQTLCKKLLQLPEMESPGRRDHLLRQLTLEYPGFRGVPRDDDPHVDLMEIVSAAYERPGALRALVDAVAYLHPADARVEAIKALVDPYDPENLLLSAERRVILTLLVNNTTVETLSSAFRHSVRITAHEAMLEPGDFAAVARYVENRRIRPGRLPPFFEFVDFVAHSCTVAGKTQMHRWMDDVAMRLGFSDREHIDKLCRVTDNRLTVNGCMYLVAQVRPDRLRPGRFFLAAWRQREDEPEEPIYTRDESVHRDEAIKITHEILSYLVNEIATETEQSVLEVILPRGMVTQKVDQWPVNDGLLSPAGTTHPLVIRSFERLDSPSMHGSWGRNWRWIKQHDRNAGATAIREVRTHEITAAQGLRAALLRDGAPAVALMLTALSDSDALAPDAYTAGLRGGAPIMLWSRNDEHAGTLSDSVREACTASLLNLRQHIFSLRLLALENDGVDTVGAHTVLIFDDFDRIPEQFRSRSRLQSPRPVEIT